MGARLLQNELRTHNKVLRQARQQMAPGDDWSLSTTPILLRRPRREGLLHQAWFRTRGCTYDYAAQCSMCNYGIGPDIDEGRIIEAVRRGLAEIPLKSMLYLSPSGSLLDPNEVSPSLLDAVLNAVAEREPASYAFESRPEFVTTGRVEKIRRALGDAAIACHLGVESWDDAIRTTCHLKPTSRASYLAALETLSANRVASIANIALGGLGLSPREAYLDTVSTIASTRAAGFTIQMVFPLSAKFGTLLGWAESQGLWQPMPLWSLVHALAEASEDGRGASDLDVSWYDPPVSEVVLKRPDGCASCRPLLVSSLGSFRSDPDSRHLEPLLRWAVCSCPDQARDLVLRADDTTWRDRLRTIVRAREAPPGTWPTPNSVKEDM